MLPPESECQTPLAPASELDSPVFCVVLHDVAGVFRSEIREVVRQLKVLVGQHFTCAVVPQWHGQDDPQALSNVISTCEECAEWMIHGMTHLRETRGGLVSWLTKQADEFGGMKLSQIQERVSMCQRLIQAATGQKPVGLVAPCWSLPVRPQNLKQIDYVMGYRSLIRCDADVHLRPSISLRQQEARATGCHHEIPLATWSYDWGRFGSVASFVNLYSELRFRFHRHVVPCVVIHPADVNRNWLPVAIKKIQKLLEQGYQPVTPRMLLAESGRVL